MHKTLSQGGGLVLGAWGCNLVIECFPSSQTVLNLTSSNTTQGGGGLLAKRPACCLRCVISVSCPSSLIDRLVILLFSLFLSNCGLCRTLKCLTLKKKFN